MQSPLNPKEAIGAYLTYTIQCPGEVGGKGCGSLSSLVTIRPLPQHQTGLCSSAPRLKGEHQIRGVVGFPIWSEAGRGRKGQLARSLEACCDLAR